MFSFLLAVLFLYGKGKGEACAWNTKSQSDEVSETAMTTFYFIFSGLAVLSLTLNMWVNVVIFTTRLWENLTYRNMFIFTSVGALRQIAILLHLLRFYRSHDDGQNIDIYPCSMIGVLEEFFAAFEVEGLTHVCIERFVVARYTDKGWLIQKKHYLLYFCSSVFFADVYTIIPMLEFNEYCSSCASSSYPIRKLIIVAIFFMRNVKPILVMVCSLVFARRLEARTGNNTQKKLTKIVILMTTLSVLCWAPSIITKSVALLEETINKKTISNSDEIMYCLRWLPCLHVFAPGMTALVLLIGDNAIRSNKFIVQRNEVIDLANNKQQKRD